MSMHMSIVAALATCRIDLQSDQCAPPTALAAPPDQRPFRGYPARVETHV